MKTYTSKNNVTTKITKKMVKQAYESEKQFFLHSNYYCSDFKDVLILSCRTIEPLQNKTATINYLYEMIEDVIERGISQIQIVSDYFNG